MAAHPRRTWRLSARLTAPTPRSAARTPAQPRGRFKAVGSRVNPTGEPHTIYLASDDAPLSREQICKEASKLEAFAGRPPPRFAPAPAAAADLAGGGKGKVLDSSRTREALRWEPTHRTFGAFVEAALAEEKAAVQ